MKSAHIGNVCLCLAALSLLSCGTASETTSVDEIKSPAAGASIQILDMTGCKDFATGIPLASAPSEQDCVEWWYVGGNVLHLRHINAGFNCCPTVDVDIRVEGGVITVEEIEIEGLCHCLCLFDVDYTIENLPPGVYELGFVEPYRPVGDPVLQVTLDIEASPSGRFCVSRSQYPWGF